MIYTGKQSTRDGKGNVIDVYLKNTWVILVDGKSEVVVTLYKIDLGLDDEFNKTYEPLLDKKRYFENMLTNMWLEVHRGH